MRNIKVKREFEVRGNRLACVVYFVRQKKSNSNLRCQIAFGLRDIGNFTQCGATSVDACLAKEYCE